MFYLNEGDKVKIVSNKFNDFYSGKEFEILCRRDDNYKLKNGTPYYYFNISDFEYIQPQTLTIEMVSDKDVVVNCRSIEDAEYFCKWLHLHDKRWYTGSTYLNDTNYSGCYKNDIDGICYCVSTGDHCDINWYQTKEPKTIIRFVPSMIKTDLVWKADKNYKINVSESKKSNKNRVLWEAYVIDNMPIIKDIKFNGIDTIVKFEDKEIKVTCQNNDTYSKEQAITQAIAKYCGYGTKKINELIEKYDIKEKFKPYLEMGITNYGIIGDNSLFKDLVGRKIFVGDIVEIFSPDNKYWGDAVVCKTDKWGFFFTGEAAYLNRNIFNNKYKIILHEKYSDIKNNETVNGIKYIKSPLKPNSK